MTDNGLPKNNFEWSGPAISRSSGHCTVLTTGATEKNKMPRSLVETSTEAKRAGALVLFWKLTSAAMITDKHHANL